MKLVHSKFFPNYICTKLEQTKLNITHFFIKIKLFKMFKSILITILLFAGIAHAQSTDYYRWEAITKGGNIVYGLENTKQDVLKTIESFNIRNKNTNNILLFHKIKKSRTLNENLITEFYIRNDKNYRVLSRAEFMTLHINEVNNFDSAVRYYTKSREIDINESTAHVKTLIKESNICMIRPIR